MTALDTKLPPPIRKWLATVTKALNSHVASIGVTMQLKNKRHVEAGWIDGNGYVIVDGVKL